MANNVPPELEDKFKRCKEHMMGQGQDESSAYGICYSAVVEGKADEAAKYGFFLTDAEKAQIVSYWTAKFGNYAVKAVSEGVLEVRAIPFDSEDSDKQHFASDTDIMSEQFQTPAIMYQHSLEQGAKGFQGKPEVIGKAIPGSLEKRSDGWYIRVALNMASKLAQGIWEAAKKGMVAVSSGSVSHLARLWRNGKMIPYDKRIPGKIAVWPFAELSLWEKGNGNFNASNPYAVALPVIKAVYRDAGLKFPDISTLSYATRPAGVRPEIAGMEKQLDQIKKQLRDIGKSR